MVGRASELARLSELLNAPDGPGALFLTGSGGLGKTRLAVALSEEAARGGWTVALGRAYPAESSLAYALVSDAFVPILNALPAGALNTLTRGGEQEIASLLPALGLGGAPASEAADPAEFKTRLFWNFTNLVARLAERHRLLVVLEDLQWAGDSSLELLHFMVRNLGGSALRVLATYNADLVHPNGPVDRVQASLRGLGLAEHMTLGPLAREESRLLVRHLFGVDGSVSDRLSDRVHAWTGGNPLFLRETFRSLVASGQLREEGGVWLGWEATELELPSSIRESILRHLEGLTPEARRVADALAVAGGPAEHRFLGQVGGVGQEALLAALDELRAASVTRDEAVGDAVVHDFAHPLVRDTLYAELGLVRRHVLHAAAVRALRAMRGDKPGPASGEIAYHLVRAGDLPEAGGRVPHLLRAGSDALERHASAEAERYLEAALTAAEAADGTPTDGTPDSDRSEVHARILTSLAQAKQQRGRYEDAVALWERALEDIRDDASRTQVLRSLGLVSYWGGRHDAALEFLGRGIEVAGALPAAEAALRLARGACLLEVGRPVEARADLEAALSLAEAVDDIPLRARAHRALAIQHTWTGPPASVVAHAERALELAHQGGEPNVTFWSHWALAVMEGIRGNTDVMAYEIDRAEAAAAAMRSPVLRIWAAELRLERAYATGEWETGLAVGEGAIAEARRLNQPNLLPRLLVWTALIYLGRGILERGRAMADEAWARAGLDRGEGGSVDIHTAVPAHIGRAACHLAEEDWPATVEVARAGLALADRSGYTIWGIHHLQPLIAEAMIRARDLRGAAALAERLRRESTRLDHKLGLAWADACEALVIWLEGDLDEGISRLRAAAEALESVPLVPDAVRIRRQLAARLADAGRDEEAVSELRGLHAQLTQLGMRRELEKARLLFKKLDTRPPPLKPMEGSGQLTGRELEIARLVTDGGSNKGVAKALGLSPRTVTTHLANLYRKLDISSRHELAHLVRTGRVGGIVDDR
jgi:DNA-binding CsgD family transcriptional regulator